MADVLENADNDGIGVSAGLDRCRSSVLFWRKAAWFVGRERSGEGRFSRQGGISDCARGVRQPRVNQDQSVASTETPASTRDRIVELADQLFYERGYEHTSFADIASAVNLSRGNFYYHFKSKDDILDAVIERRSLKTQGMLDSWSADADNPVERIGRFIQVMVMNSTRIRKHGCPVGTLCAELSKLEHPYLPKASRLFTLFRDWLASQFAQLGAQHNANALAMHLLARSQGIATLANAFDDETFIHQEAELLLRWLHAVSGSSSASSGG